MRNEYDANSELANIYERIGRMNYTPKPLPSRGSYAWLGITLLITIASVGVMLAWRG